MSMSKLYRIYTENTRKQHLVRQAVNKCFDGYTLLKGVGYWQGTRELSLIIEIIAEAADRDRIKALAEEIKVVNEQQAVLWTEQDIVSWLV